MVTEKCRREQASADKDRNFRTNGGFIAETTQILAGKNLEKGQNPIWPVKFGVTVILRCLQRSCGDLQQSTELTFTGSERQDDRHMVAGPAPTEMNLSEIKKRKSKSCRRVPANATMGSWARIDAINHVGFAWELLPSAITSDWYVVTGHCMFDSICESEGCQQRWGSKLAFPEPAACSITFLSAVALRNPISVARLHRPVVMITAVIPQGKLATRSKLVRSVGKEFLGLHRDETLKPVSTLELMPKGPETRVCPLLIFQVVGFFLNSVRFSRKVFSNEKHRLIPCMI